jgi:hypothetical protein
MNRRRFLKGLGAGSVLVGGVVLGNAPAAAQDEEKKKEKVKYDGKPPEVETNLDDFTKVKKANGGMPGAFPGKVVKVTDPGSLEDDEINASVVRDMFRKGITKLTGKGLQESFDMLFSPDDIVGLKPNSVGAPLINTHHELIKPVIEWLVECGMPKKNIVLWERFQPMMESAGYTRENYPDITLASLQTYSEKGNAWKEKDGTHVSAKNFDLDAVYRVKGLTGKKGVNAEDDETYKNQQVFDGEESYFGKVVTKKLTKIINLPGYKNAGNAISMACKNLGYGAICNTARLHTREMYFKVFYEVLAAPWLRDKVVLNITDGLRGQYDGGPGSNAQFVYPNHSLYFATDPFAVDAVCHKELMAKRKAMEVKTSDNPTYTSYLVEGQKLGLGIGDLEKIELLEETA